MPTPAIHCTWEVEDEDSGVQRHPHLCGELEASLGPYEMLSQNPQWGKAE